MKVIIVANDYDYVNGGASAVAISNANIFSDNGYKVIFFCGISNPLKTTLNKSIEVISNEKEDPISSKHQIHSALSGIYNFKARRKLNRLLHLFPNSVVIMHGITKILSVSVIDACKKNHVKCILTAHDYLSICPNGVLFDYSSNKICNINGFSKTCSKTMCDSRSKKFKFYRLIRFIVQEKIVCFRKKIDIVITISDFSEKILKENKAFNVDKMRRIDNPCDLIPKNSSHIPGDYFLFIGRISKEKGVDLMCSSFSKTKQNLKIAGDGPDFLALKEKYSSNSNISFLGWQNTESIQMLLKWCRALIFPSIWYECAPLTIKEAQSAGVFCIVSSLCAGKDFIDNHNGITYNPFDKNELTNIIQNVRINELHTITNDSRQTYLNEMEKVIDSL